MLSFGIKAVNPWQRLNAVSQIHTRGSRITTTEARAAAFLGFAPDFRDIHEAILAAALYSV